MKRCRHCGHPKGRHGHTIDHTVPWNHPNRVSYYCVLNCSCTSHSDYDKYKEPKPMTYIVVHGYSPDIVIERFADEAELFKALLYSDTITHGRDMIIAKIVDIRPAIAAKDVDLQALWDEFQRAVKENRLSLDAFVAWMKDKPHECKLPGDPVKFAMFERWVCPKCKQEWKFEKRWHADKVDS